MARSSDSSPTPTPVAPAEGRGRGLAELFGGVVLGLAGFAITALAFDTATASGGKVIVAYGPVLAGFALAARGAIRLSPPTVPARPARPDARRWIYGGLALGFGVVQAVALITVIANRLPAAYLHLWSLPVLTTIMGVATLAGGRHGWWVAVFAGSGVLLATALVIVRILISVAFLAGVYGAFGKAAATFSLTSVALIVEVVALLPIFQVKWLMSRSGRRAYGA